MDSKIFREQAVKKKVSPVDLNELIHVIKPSAWLILVGVGLTLFVLILWGFLGETATKIQGTGIIIKVAGNRTLISSGSGQLLNVGVKVGDSVRIGQVVGMIEQPELKQRLEDAKVMVNKYTIFNRASLEEHWKDSLVQSNNNRFQHQALKEKLFNLNNRLESLEKREKNLKVLADQGLVTQSSVFDIQQQINANREQIEASKWDNDQLDVKLHELEFSKRNALIDSRNQLSMAEQNLSDVQVQYDKASKLISDYQGNVLELMVLPGSFIGDGSPLLSIETKEKDVEAMLFIPPYMADEIETGMEVEIIPTTVHVEEYGFVCGKVRCVSKFPVTVNGMMSLLGNSKLVEMLSYQGAPYRVDVELIPDTAAYSEYKWSSSKGPRTKLPTGTICTGRVITRKQAPITLVIPFVKKFLGISHD